MKHEAPADKKYIVFHRDEWERRSKNGLTMLEESSIPDAVVIRRQDMAAPPILDAYSNFYQSVHELLVSLGEGSMESLFDHGALQQRIDKCSELADYFHEQALASWETDRKFPT